VPIVVVVKCGTDQERMADSPAEVAKKKPGNRGKRDSQMILLNFLSRVTFNERMTGLDYDLFYKIQKVTVGITADLFEVVLMIDADTSINTDSISLMVQTMNNNPTVMGLCGETRIANKRQSWVTRIQVYEYFTSHNLGKAFESFFGGVTCLPGCFSMYRIKAKKTNGWTVPLIIAPSIVETYAEHIVDTLHKKNLLLLGEDRFLSTLMLKTFPKRSMVFVPDAICHTTVPHTYKMLQSQRRRWINSTIHVTLAN
jgi:cellulose synthase/poly-beta-1,6-N-acetylglucosamine synthase-like glycosyltransferase